MLIMDYANFTPRRFPCNLSRFPNAQRSYLWGVKSGCEARRTGTLPCALCGLRPQSPPGQQHLTDRGENEVGT